MNHLEDFLGLSIVAATIVLIARWQVRGVLIAIPFGYVAIYLLNVSFRHDQWSDIEFAEDWPLAGLIVMPLWSVVVLFVVWFCSLLIKVCRQNYGRNA